MNLQYSLNVNHDSGISEASSPVSLYASYMSDPFDSPFSKNSGCDTPVFSQASANQTKVDKAEDRVKNAKTRTKSKKAYTCKYCQKVFSRPSALQTHAYTHTAEKPFQCLSPNCGRYFSVVSNLRRHFKVHQKAQNNNKLSSEDRIRCVKLLMQRSSAMMSGFNGNNRQRQTNRTHPIIPATSFQYNGSVPHSYLPSPPLRFTPTFENRPIIGEADQSLLFGNSLFNTTQLWPTRYDQDLQCCQSDNDMQSDVFSPYLPHSLSEQLSYNGASVSDEKSGDDYFSL